MTTDQENTAPLFFTASNGLTVQRLGLNRFRARGPYGTDDERGIIQGESTLRALVEYAASIGITAEPPQCASVHPQHGWIRCTQPLGHGDPHVNADHMGAGSWWPAEER